MGLLLAAGLLAAVGKLGGVADGRVLGEGGAETDGAGVRVLVEAMRGAAVALAGVSGVARRAGATQLAAIPALVAANQRRIARRDQYAC